MRVRMVQWLLFSTLIGSSNVCLVFVASRIRGIALKSQVADMSMALARGLDVIMPTDMMKSLLRHVLTLPYANLWVWFPKIIFMLIWD